MADFTRVRPSVDSHLGWRLRVDKQEDELTEIYEERVLPEQVANPQARHVSEFKRINLTWEDVKWLHATLGELIKESDDA